MVIKNVIQKVDNAKAKTEQNAEIIESKRKIDAKNKAIEDGLNEFGLKFKDWHFIERFIFNGNTSYLMLNSNKTKYIPITADYVRGKARTFGINQENLIDYLINYRYTNRVFDFLGGHKQGFYSSKGDEYLVKRSPIWLDGRKGSCETILSLLRSRFDDPGNQTQIHHLLGWIKQFRAICKQYMENQSQSLFSQILCIAGSQNDGKSWIVKKIFAPMFGIYGKEMNDASGFLRKGGKGFNAEMMSAVLHVADDSLSSSTDAQRRGFTEAEKSLSYAGIAGYEAKGKDPFSMSLPTVFVHLMNLELNHMKAFPIIEGDDGKFIAIKSGNYERFIMSNGTLQEKDEVDKRLESELEAFAYYLDNEYNPPDEVLDKGDLAKGKNPRHLVKEYVHPDIKELVFTISEECQLLDLIDTNAKNRVITPSEIYDKKMKAEDIWAILSGCELTSKSFHYDIKKLVKNSRFLATKLTFLSEKCPDRVSFTKPQGTKYFIISKPNE